MRLHESDYENITLTGIEVLEKIKGHNPGIQVIIFSATNNIWNLQSLQDRADGFIIKESPENSIDKRFTDKAIRSLKNSIKTSLKRKFLKEVFKKCKLIGDQLKECEYEDDSEYQKFLKDLKKQINLISYASMRINLEQPATLDIVFLNCYNFLEKFKHYYLYELDRQFVLGIDEIEMNRYFIRYGKFENGGKFLRLNLNDDPSWFNVLAGLFIDYFSISKVNDREISDLDRIKNKRNEYIHNSKSSFDSNELLMILSLCEKITSRMRE